MRIIHTSDWHLGQHFINKSRESEHQAFFTWLLAQVDEHQVDAIIVAGDVFDTGSPPSYARRLYNQFIVDLQQHQCQLLVLGGNHDSVAMLNESTELVACLNTYVIPYASQQWSQQVVMLDTYTPHKRPGCLVCAIPFIRPRDVQISQAGQSSGEKQLSLQQAIAEHYQQVFAIAQAKAQQYQPPLPIVATGHLTCVGASSSSSVRDIYIGSLEAFPASGLPAADYIALGHIHQPQTVAGNEYIRYCGSPIPLSFDEVGRRKTVNLVELGSDEVTVTPLDIPVFQPMRQIRGNLKEIEQQLATLKDYDPKQPVWLDIEVASHEYVTEFQSQIETMCGSLPVEILLLRRAKHHHDLAAVEQDQVAQVTLRELNPMEVFEKRLEQEPMSEEQEQQHLARLNRVRRSFAQVAALSEQQLDPIQSQVLTSASEVN